MVLEATSEAEMVVDVVAVQLMMKLPRGRTALC